MIPLITSSQNPRIKSVLALAKTRERAERGVFALEGVREIVRAIQYGYQPVEAYWCDDVLSPMARQVLATMPKQTVRVPVSASVYGKLAVREGSDGLVVVMQQKHHGLLQLSNLRPRLMLAVQGVEKPGNLGALLRSADGAGVDALFLIDQTIDLYNPLVLRASVGTAFSIPVVAASSSDLRNLANEHGWQIIAAALHPKALSYTQMDLSKPTVILLGTEAHGLTERWLRDADQLVTIPMRGIADSLNVSVAGAILLYEARRQILIGGTA